MFKQNLRMDFHKKKTQEAKTVMDIKCQKNNDQLRLKKLRLPRGVKLEYMNQ